MTDSRSISPLFLSGLLAAALLLGAATDALAHRVNIFAWVEGDQVHAEATFSGGKPSMDSPIDVQNAATGETYMTVHTDDAGHATFPVPEAARKAKADLRLVLHASMGHQNDWTVKADEYADPAPVDMGGDTAKAAAPAASSTGVTYGVSVPAKTPAAAGSVSYSVSAPATAATTPVTAMNEQALAQLVEQAVNRAVDARLAPVKRMLAEQVEAGPGLSDIVGGLGWIMGLIGLAAWMRSRRRSA